MVECTVQQPSYAPLYALDFCQSAIDTFHYALPFLMLNALETRLAFPDTSYKQKTEEAVVEAIWRKNYISLQAILQRSGAMAGRSPTVYISNGIKTCLAQRFFPLKRG